MDRELQLSWASPKCLLLNSPHRCACLPGGRTTCQYTNDSLHTHRPVGRQKHRPCCVTYKVINWQYLTSMKPNSPGAMDTDGCVKVRQAKLLLVPWEQRHLFWLQRNLISWKIGLWFYCWVWQSGRVFSGDLGQSLNGESWRENEGRENWRQWKLTTFSGILMQKWVKKWDSSWGRGRESWDQEKMKNGRDNGSVVCSWRVGQWGADWQCQLQWMINQCDGRLQWSWRVVELGH